MSETAVGAPAPSGEPDAIDAVGFDVVIPTIGRPSLVALLDALDRGRGPLPRRVLVVDDRPRTGAALGGDGPPGATLGVGDAPPHGDAPPWGDWTPSRLAGRLVALSCGGRGPAAARNIGWLAGDAEWVAFLDDDVLPGPEWLGELAADLAAAGADVGGVQGRIQVPLPEGRRPTDWERNVRMLERARWPTADMAYRRAALEAVGGFDQRFPRAYREDSDLAIRVERAGYRLAAGGRRVEHPVRPAAFWTSVRLQRGNADDVLMRALHGDWEEAARRGRRRRHVATTAAALGAAVGFGLGWAPLGAISAAAWLGATAEFAWARIAPGPRTAGELGRMLATSVVIPPVAFYWWLAGLARRRRLLAAGPQLGTEPGSGTRAGASLRWPV
jgi:glycosyltransferase involved in cell wall biosynthesis